MPTQAIALDLNSLPQSVVTRSFFGIFTLFTKTPRVAIRFIYQQIFAVIRMTLRAVCAVCHFYASFFFGFFCVACISTVIVTGAAFPSSFFQHQVMSLKYVTVIAVRFHGIFRYGCIPSKQINAAGDGFDVGGINAVTDSAEMVAVQLRVNGGNEQAVYQSVSDEPHFLEIGKTVAAFFAAVSDPLPAWNAFVEMSCRDLNTSEKIFNQFTRNGNAIIIQDGHLLNNLHLFSNLALGLGSVNSSSPLFIVA